MPAPKEFDKLWHDVKDGLAQMRAFIRNPFANTPLSATEPGVLEITGNLRLILGALLSSSFNGTDFAHPGTVGNYFGDDGVVLNNAYFRPGSVGNDALSNPIQVGSTVGGATGFAVTTTATKRAQATMTVPAGFSQALVFCFVNGAAFNDTAAMDFLTVQAAVNGVTGGGVIATTDTGEFSTTVTAVRASTLSGLSGGDTVTAEAWCASQGAGWSAFGSNFVFINAFAIWLR